MTTVADSPLLVTLSFDIEDERKLSPPKQVQVEVTAELARTFARAAAFNRSDSTPLSFTSLLIGMLTGSGPISSWVYHALGGEATVERVAARKVSLSEKDILRTLDENYSSLPVLATSISARRAIEEGQAIAASISGDSPLELRHLIAAFPILREWHEKDFIDLQIDRLAWCRDFGAYMAEQFADEKWYWRDYADRAAPVPLTSFSADVYTERDLLGIDRSVDALALLMASTRTDTPLSIGVFGPWGSGKSFFMRHLRRRIWTLAERERDRVGIWREKRRDKKATADDAPLYYANVAQVDFNAWHYNEGNLVASLVDHIFRNLRVRPATKESDEEVQERQRDVLVKITNVKADLQTAVKEINKVQTEVNAAKDDVQRAKADVTSIRQVIDAKTTELTTWTGDAARASDQLDGAIRDVMARASDVDPGAVVWVALTPLAEAPVVDDIRKAGQSLAATLTDWKTFASRLRSPLGLSALALIVAAPLVARFTHWLTNTYTAMMTAGAATLIATVGPILKIVVERRAEFESKMKQIERAAAERRDEQVTQLEKQRDAVRAEWEKKLGTLRSALEKQQAALKDRETRATEAVRTLAEKTRDLDVKMQERTNAEVKLQQLESHFKRLSSALLLDEFIKDRASSDDYRKQLSFLALVRRDFERLSDLIAAANTDWCDPAKDIEPPLLNRIVLYIDDLDRCRVETVLKVLEVVHLLLAFPLFVCVVAVDPRWIEKCLQQQKAGVFDSDTKTGDIHVTVGDYLEKIFQIPIWMKPIDSRQRTTLVKTLLGATAAPASRGVAAQHAAQEQRRLLQPEPGLDSQDASDGFKEIVKKALERPDPLRITVEEAQYVDEVGALLSDKPRALKRFVNTYRLLKASLSEIDQKTFVTTDPSSPYKVCIAQLAFFTGQPRLAPKLVSYVELPHLRTAADDTTSIDAWFKAVSDSADDALKTAFASLPDRGAMTIGRFREWLPETSKYLFHRNE
jgi:hypothetical protein